MLFRSDARRDKARLSFFNYVLKNLALRDGEITRPAAGGAAAVWIPSEAWGSQFWLDEVRALPVLLATTGLGRFGRLLALRNAMDKHHPTDRAHEYLWFLGVTPSGQGHGIGSRLLKSKLDQLDAAGRPAFLETSSDRNVALYRRHGFEVTANYRPTPDGPPTFGMWRDPS